MRVICLWSGLFVSALVLGSVYWLLTRTWPVAALTAEEKQMTEKLFEQTKTECFGRYLFDVPVSFTNALTDQVWIDDVRIASKRLFRPAFEQRIRLREQELKNSHTVDPIDGPFLKQVYRINSNTVIFDRNVNESVAGFGRILEGHLYHNGVSFVLTSKFRDVSDPKYQQDREEYLNSGTKKNDLNDKPQRLAEMQNLLSRLGGREDKEVPTQPGFCIPQGFIVDDNTSRKEKITLRYDLSDFYLSVYSENTSRKGESLLTWGKRDIEPALLSIRAHTLQKGRVALPGIDAEEWLVKGSQEVRNNNYDAYRFILYANEKVADNHHPLFSVKLHNSGLETKNYTDSQLVEVWRRMVRTFRYRPNAF